MDTRVVFLRFRERKPPVQFGPEPKPFSLRLQELADELQPKVTEWEYKQLCDLAHERFKREKRKEGSM